MKKTNKKALTIFGVTAILEIIFFALGLYALFYFGLPYQSIWIWLPFLFSMVGDLIAALTFA